MTTEFQKVLKSYPRTGDGSADPRVLAASARANDVLNQTSTPTLPYVHLSASPVPGSSFTAGTTVALSSDRPGTLIYYTTDGSEPSAASTLYSGPITVNSSQTIKALGIADGHFDGTLTAAYVVIAAPVITVHPQSQTVDESGSVLFTVTATGTAALLYQWRKGGVDIDGATASSLTIPSAVEGDEGSYDCVVSNAYGSATSNAATLTVNSSSTWQTGLVRAWTMDEISGVREDTFELWPLEEAGGPIASTPGVFGNAARFVSGNSKSLIWNHQGGPDNLQVPDGLTLAARIKTADLDHYVLYLYGGNFSVQIGVKDSAWVVTMENVDVASAALFNTGDWHVVAVSIKDGVVKLYIDGALLDTGSHSFDIQNPTYSYGILMVGNNPNVIGGSAQADVDDVRLWNREVPLGQISEAYVDAQAEVEDWLDRVATAGGTVSAETISAVTSFVGACKLGGFWTKFRRLNLFAGNQLEAALVPLVDTLGTPADTNNGFAGGDYSEGVGLTGNGTSKYLATGLLPTDIQYDSVHLAAYVCNQGVANLSTEIGSTGHGSSNVQTRLLTNHNNGGSMRCASYLGDFNLGSNFQFKMEVATVPVGLVVASRTAENLSRLSDNGGLLNTNTALYNGFTVLASNEITVFARNNGTSRSEYSSKTLGAYSVGIGLTQTDVDAYTAAMQAFQAALGREV